MQLEKIKTYDELRFYLLARMEFADNKKSKANSTFTKEQMWNMYMKDCVTNKGELLPIRTISILKKRVKKDFNQSI